MAQAGPGRTRVKRLIYGAAAFLQGIGLIYFPGSSFVLKAPRFNALTEQQYGLLFLPMMGVAILASLNFDRLLAAFGRKGIYYAGLAANFLNLVLLAATASAYGNNALSLSLSFGAQFFLGAAFGLLMPVLNVLVIELEPGKRDSALTVLHGCLGAGCAAAPLLAAYSHGRGWWSAGLAAWAAAIVLLAFFSAAFPSAGSSSAAVLPGGRKAPSSMPLPAGARLFLAALALYGICEAILGNWSTPYLTGTKGMSATSAALALSLFWVSIMAGRLSAPALNFRFRPVTVFILSPLVILSGLALIFSARSEGWLLAAYALAGWGCSSFFPLAISLSTGAYDSWREKLASLAVTALMSGCALGSSAVGFLLERQMISLPHAFLIAAAATAAALALVLCVTLARPRGAGFGQDFV